MEYIDDLSLLIPSNQESFPSKSKKFYLTLFSIIRLVSAAKLETTYQSIIRFGISLFFSPLAIFFLIFFYKQYLQTFYFDNRYKAMGGWYKN
jgi:hypothetical protein